MAAVISRSVYLPRYRLPTSTLKDRWGGGSNGVKTKSVQATDDDALTLGIRAGERALNGNTVDALFFASSTALYEYGSATPFLAEALGCKDSVHARTLTGSDRTGVGALKAAHDAVDSGSDRALVVTGNAPEPSPGTDKEKTLGAGAGAVLVSDTDGGLQHIATGSHTRNVLDQWQAPGESDRHTADDRYARNIGYVETIVEAVQSALNAANWNPEDVDSLVLNQPNPKFPSRVTSALGLPDGSLAAPAFAREYGDLGAAGVTGVLGHADFEPGQRIVVAGYGTGMADALAYEVEEIPAQDNSIDEDVVELDYPDYLEHTNQLR